MKIGRNDKCPCGSGKKYKKCCNANDNIKLAYSRQNEPETQSNFDQEEPDLIQYFGYDTPRSESESPFDLPEEGLCCMVSSVNKDIQQEINTMIKHPLLQLGKGQWIITANDDTGKMKFSGPYDSAELAMDSASEKFGAIRFKSTPDFI